MGRKCPLKTVALAVDEKEEAIKSSRGRAQSWWRPSRAWEAKVECQWHGKVAWKSNEDTTTKWKINKWRYATSKMNNNTMNKTSQKFSQASNIAGNFWLLTSKIYIIYIIYIIYVIHNFNYLWLLMIIDNYF